MKSFQNYFPQIEFLKKQGQAYLDSAATTLKPYCVIDVLKKIYMESTANVHRGDHYLSSRATAQYEETREEVRQWIGAEQAQEIIFTKSTTEGINFLAYSLEDFFKPGDEIITTQIEHHSNFLPWLRLAKKQNLKLKILPVNEKGELKLSTLKAFKNAKLIAFSFYSNALGTRFPVEALIKWAKENKVLTVVDAAQAMTAEPVNVQKLACDFLLFSAHKLFAPAGLGILYANKKHQEKMQAYQLGGGMVVDVGLSDFDKARPPHCFEAGTPPIESVLSFRAVLQFLKEQNYFEQIKNFNLLEQAEKEIKTIPGLVITAPNTPKKHILSFNAEGVHPADLGQLISQSGAAVRSGHHCCLPLMKALNIPDGTVRASFALYNDAQDVALLIKALKKALKILL